MHQASDSDCRLQPIRMAPHSLMRHSMRLRFLQQGKDLLPLHTGKTFEKVCNAVTRLEMVEQTLNRYPGPGGVLMWLVGLQEADVCSGTRLVVLRSQRRRRSTGRNPTVPLSCRGVGRKAGSSVAAASRSLVAAPSPFEVFTLA